MHLKNTLNYFILKKQLMIKVRKYRQARQTLINAGSDSAGKSHNPHDKEKAVKDHYGTDLLNGAMNEFTINNVISELHQKALDKARDQMGL